MAFPTTESLVREVGGEQRRAFLAAMARDVAPGGEPYETRPGMVLWFEAGMPDVWHIPEPTLKVFLASSDRPLPS